MEVSLLIGYTLPLHFRPDWAFYCLQLVLFSNLFWSDVWQDDISWKQIDMDYLGNTDKQTKWTLARSSIKFFSRFVYGHSIS